MNYRKKFIVEPGEKVHLAKIDPSDTGKHESHEKATPETGKNIARMEKLQYLLYADASQSSARRTAGARRRRQGRRRAARLHRHQPAGNVRPWLQAAERRGARPRFPLARPPARAGQGRDRRSSTARTTRTCSSCACTSSCRKSVWSKRYDLINEFEKMLVENGIAILKFFLHISPEEQLDALQAAARRSRRATGRSPKATTPSASSGRDTSRPTKTRSRSAAPSTRRGTSSRPTTSGSATSPSRRSSPIRWTRWA